MRASNQGFHVIWVSLFLAAALAAGSGAQEKGAARPEKLGVGEVSKASAAVANESPAAPEAAKAAVIVYKPPPRGAPRARIGGGVRGARAMPTPLALVPEHVGMTARSAPALYWHVDGVPDDRVRIFFTLVEEGGRRPVVERELRRPKSAGIQRVRLRDYGATLRSGVVYEWSIAMVPDMGKRSHDLVALAYIERVPARDSAAGDAEAEARAGLWYDAFETLSNQIAANPGAAKPRRERAELLKQVGLDAAVP